MITQPTHILSVDPGKLTGVAWIRVDRDEPAEVEKAYEVPGTLDEIIEVFRIWCLRTEGVYYGKSRRVLCEDWIPFDTDFATKPALAIEPMAWLKLLAHQAGIPIETPNSQQRLVMTDEQLKAAGYWQRGGRKGDKRSAVRHGLAWCMRQPHVPTYERLHPRS